MSTIKTNAILDASGGSTTTINGVTPNAYNTMGKNRIINGAMEIDQRNAGASVTATTSTVYTVDRWGIYGQQASKFTAQQNAGSVTPPAGFKNYLGITSSSAYSVLAGDNFKIVQPIEGLNCADLGFGTSDAKTLTLSFWVRSSLTGTFGGSFTNSVYNRSYPFTYSISAANTWEQKSITFTADTSGTWLTTNGIGVNVIFSMGMGTDQSGTAGAWAAGNYQSATGATSVVGTSGATFYITGVQLEVGSTATEFERRPYGTELSLCQRYYQKYTGNTTSYPLFGVGQAYSANQIMGVSKGLTTTMRAYPTASLTGTWYARRYDASSDVLNNPTIAVSTNFVSINGERNNSGLTAGHACTVWSETGSLILSAEL